MRGRGFVPGPKLERFLPPSSSEIGEQATSDIFPLLQEGPYRDEDPQSGEFVKELPGTSTETGKKRVGEYWQGIEKEDEDRNEPQNGGSSPQTGAL